MKKKHNEKSFFKSLFLSSLILASNLLASATPLPNELPTGASVQAGNVSFNQNGNVLDVNSASNSSIVNYQTFNIGSNAIVNFNLPSSSSAILNRVLGGNVSEIFGQINSNGRVFLVSPPGIIFGSGSQVNVNSMFASTLAITNSNFLLGNYLFENTGVSKAIINQGLLKGIDSITLLAGAINNIGSIEAPLVNLAVGDKITASLGSGVNVDVVVNDELKQNVNGINDAINNSGSIKGTLISLKTNLENGIYENAVNNTGLVSASSMLDILGQTQNTIQETQTVTETIINNNGTLNDPTDDFNEQVQKQVLVDKIVTSIDGTVNNSSTLEGGSLKIEAGVLENNPNAIIESTIGNLDIKLSGSRKASAAPLDNTLVHNGSSPPTQRAFGYTYKEISPPYTFGKIKQPGVVRINEKYYIQTPILNETINYSLLNKGTIQSANDLNITSNNGPIMNRSGSSWDASLIAANNINLDAPNILNQRGGFYTTYRYEQLWIGSALHDFEYWTDQEPGTNAFILSGNDLNIKSSNFTNQAGSVEVGNNLNFNTDPGAPKNGNFSNISKILQETKHEHWVRRRFGGKDNRDLWGGYSVDSPAADLYIEYDMNLGTLTNPINNFTNTGLINVGNFNAFGNGDFVNGITDRNIQNPSNFIPGTIQAERFRFNAENYDIPIGYFLNTGLIRGTNQVVIKAQKIENIRRTAIASKNIKRYKGLFSASRFEQVLYDSIQSGGEIKGGQIFLTSADEFLNKGGLIKANTLLSIKANKITNTVQEGSEIVTWDPGNLGKLFGRQNWGLKSVYEPGTLASDGEIVLTAQNSSNGGSIFNIGSDIIAKGDVTIKADKLVEQNWVASHYTSSDSTKLRGLKVTRNIETAHVTRSSTIASTEGNVNIEVGTQETPSAPFTEGTFKNTASDVLANNNINISAKNIEISDAIHQSTDKHSQYGLLSYEAPTKFSVGGIETKNTKTTQRSSNFIAGNALRLSSGGDSGAISITGSNLAAGNKISLTGDNINIKNGEYTNKIEQKGFEFGAGWTFTKPIGDIHATAWNLDGSQTILTPSNLIANEILINSQNTNLIASNLNANNSIEINTNTFNSNGNFQTADSKVDFAGLSVTPAIQGVSVNLTAGKSNTNSGEYVFANIHAPNVSINTNNSNVQGTIINGQSINAPSETSYSNTNTSSVGASFNPATGFGGITYSQTENGKGFFGGIGTNGLFGGFINGDWALGSNLGPPGQSTSATLTPFISNAQYGSTFSTTLGFTQGTSSHFFIAPNFNYQGLFNAGAAFQGGQLVGISYTTPLGSINEVFTPFQYTCFPKGTRIRVRRKKNGNSGDEEEYEELDLEIEKIKIDDQVLSWNEQTEKLEWKFVLDTYIRKNNKLIVIQLVNGTIIKATPEHPFFVEGSWINASELKEGMKLLSTELNKIAILSINEEILPNEIEVFNLNIQDNHNYFAENILVHNDYVTLSIEITDDANKVKDAEVPEQRIEALNDLNQSLNDLRKFTNSDTSITGFIRNDALREINNLNNELHFFKQLEVLSGNKTITNYWLDNRLSSFIQSDRGQFLGYKSGDLIADMIVLTQIGNETFYNYSNQPKTTKDKNGNTILVASKKIIFTYGNSSEDPPVALLKEQLDELTQIFNANKNNAITSIKNEVVYFQDKYNTIKQLSDSGIKAKAIKDYWNELTSEMESAYNKVRKWEHVKRDQQFENLDTRTQFMPPEPYYAAEYDKYIQPFKKEIQEAINNQKKLADKLLILRRNFDMKSYKEYLRNEDGLYEYAGIPSPISFDDYEKIQYAAHEGSRYLGEEGNEYFYRLHAGQDIGKIQSEQKDIRGTTVLSVINGTFVREAGNEFTVKTNDGNYAIRYRHMPPSSYGQFQTGDQVFTNQPVGKVGGWGWKGENSYAPHLHFEILKWSRNPESKTYGFFTVLDPNRVEIRGGNIYEK